MEKIVGFDIGESSVKLVYFAGADLKKAVTAELPDNMVSGSRILSMDAMADFLRQAARDNGIPLTNAAVVLPSTEVFTRELTMPAMTEEDTRVTATLRVDEQAFTLSVPYGTAPTAEDVARLLTDNGISPDTIDSWTPDITQPLYADTAFTAVRKTADSGGAPTVPDADTPASGSKDPEDTPSDDPSAPDSSSSGTDPTPEPSPDTLP